jgi:hypothetical protein
VVVAAFGLFLLVFIKYFLNYGVLVVTVMVHVLMVDVSTMLVPKEDIIIPKWLTYVLVGHIPSVLVAYSLVANLIV